MPDEETLKRLDELHDRLDDVFGELKAIGVRLDGSTSTFEATAKLVTELIGAWNIEAGDAGPPKPTEGTRDTPDTINTQLSHLWWLLQYGHLTKDEYQDRRQQLVERLDVLYDLE